MNEIFALDDAAKQFSFERVNKAGAKFDWDKLNWINSQYLHHMPVDRLTDMLIPYWQDAGYEFDAEGDRAWLEQLTTVIGSSLSRLDEAVEMVAYLFKADVGFTEDATVHLKISGVADALTAVLSALKEQTEPLTEASAKAIVDSATKAAGVKKGVVMKSLRAALTGALQGPDLIQSWLLLNQHQLDQSRLTQAVAIAQSAS